ncbi:MAG: alkaline shock response membrane anchor protein AmaP [Candidatus Omnitrophica bacterium]|nr:alkaline shock response membrane anchor protein AmaP [Candidatus Omnitrophota bacterium]
MKQFNILLACSILFIFSALCLYIILWHPVGMQQAIGLILLIYNNFWGKVFIVAVGFICLGCGLSLLAHFVGLEPSNRPHILLEQDGGKVGVSLDAVEEFIKKRGLSVDGVRDLTVRAQMTDEGIALLTRVTLELQRNVPDFIQAFQGKIHYELSETLGLKKIKEVQVLIHKLLPKESGEGRLLGPPATVLLKDAEPMAAEDLPAENQEPSSGGAFMDSVEENNAPLKKSDEEKEST